MGNEMKLVDLSEFKKKAFEEQWSNVTLRKQFIIDEVKQFEDDDLTLEFTISTGTVDRDMDTLNPRGWKLDNYMKNPVVLFAHDYKSLPVANSLAVWVENDQLKSRAKFTPREVYPFGYTVGQLYKQGFMKATSVGFNPTKWQYSEERKGGVDFLEQELLEWSCVPVPANPEALVAASAQGIDVEPIKQWAEMILEESQGEGMWLPKHEIEKVFKLLDNKSIFVMPSTKKEVDGKEDKGVISYNSAHSGGTPKAPEGEAWDGPAEVAAADVDDLKIMCAWVDSENPDIKGSYKLPHHKASGQHAVVWRGVSAAMGALLGARGGVDIPEADRRGVYNHLAKHYEEFDREAPEFTEYDAEDENKKTILKAGRVLSKANEEKIRQAASLLSEVLSQLADEEHEQDEGKGDVPEVSKSTVDILTIGLDEDSFDLETINQIIKSALAESIQNITGKFEEE